MMNRIWNEESGVLTFEWILLITVLVIGIIGGVAAMRNEINAKAKEVGGAVIALNCSYTLSASATDSDGSQGPKACSYTDAKN